MKIKYFLNSKYADNNKKSSKTFFYIHGLDGTLTFSKAIFDKYKEFRVIASSIPGHMDSKIKATRSIRKHLLFFSKLIKYLKIDIKNLTIIGDSSGAAFALLLTKKISSKKVIMIGMPNRFPNIVNKFYPNKFFVYLKILATFLLNINFSYKSINNYNKLTNSKLIVKSAKIIDTKKKKYIREMLASFFAIKKAWRIIPKYKGNIIFIIPENDIMTNIDKAVKKLSNTNFLIFKNAKHIVMYEKNFKNLPI